MPSTWDGQQLMEPIAAEEPCGVNLDDSAVLASFDACQLFGHAMPLDPAPDWADLKDRALEALLTSKDLRLLVHLAPALLRTDGIAAFSRVLVIARHWLDTYWSNVFPLVEDDAIERRNVLNCLADPWAVIDLLRRLPLVESRQHGIVTLRDLDVATGLQRSAPGTATDDARIKAALAAIAPDDLHRLLDALADAAGALAGIEARMKESAGIEAVPALEGLLAVLTRMQRALQPPPVVAAGVPAEASSADRPASPASAGAGGAALAGPMCSREDALRALDAAADFFRTHEPSSPVPLFIERAKRLIAKSFIDALNDIVPEAVSQARAAAGLQRE